MKTSPGKLYIVATPIGNLEDITYRAVRILQEVDFVACEDTRTSGILLKHYNITNKTISLNAANEGKKSAEIIKHILAGENGAYVSDAGTPSVSDPGMKLVNKAVTNNIEVIAIPGASALTAALSISGIDTSSFIFEGFLPQKKGRQKKLQQLAEYDNAIVCYESVYRIEKLLTELNEYMPERIVLVFRELTKKFEEVWSGFPAELLNDISKLTVKGEFVIIIAPKNWKREE